MSFIYKIMIFLFISLNIYSHECETIRDNDNIIIQLKMTNENGNIRNIDIHHTSTFMPIQSNYSKQLKYKTRDEHTTTEEWLKNVAKWIDQCKVRQIIQYNYRLNTEVHIRDCLFNAKVVEEPLNNLTRIQFFFLSLSENGDSNQPYFEKIIEHQPIESINIDNFSSDHIFNIESKSLDKTIEKKLITYSRSAIDISPFEHQSSLLRNLSSLRETKKFPAREKTLINSVDHLLAFDEVLFQIQNRKCQFVNSNIEEHCFIHYDNEKFYIPITYKSSVIIEGNGNTPLDITYTTASSQEIELNNTSNTSLLNENDDQLFYLDSKTHQLKNVDELYNIDSGLAGFIDSTTNTNIFINAKGTPQEVLSAFKKVSYLNSISVDTQKYSENDFQKLNFILNEEKSRIKQITFLNLKKCEHFELISKAINLPQIESLIFINSHVSILPQDFERLFKIKNKIKYRNSIFYGKKSIKADEIGVQFKGEIKNDPLLIPTPSSLESDISAKIKSDALQRKEARKNRADERLRNKHEFFLSLEDLNINDLMQDYPNHPDISSNEQFKIRKKAREERRKQRNLNFITSTLNQYYIKTSNDLYLTPRFHNNKIRVSKNKKDRNRVHIIDIKENKVYIKFESIEDNKKQVRYLTVHENGSIGLDLNETERGLFEIIKTTDSKCFLKSYNNLYIQFNPENDNFETSDSVPSNEFYFEEFRPADLEYFLDDPLDIESDEYPRLNPDLRRFLKGEGLSLVDKSGKISGVGGVAYIYKLKDEQNNFWAIKVPKNTSKSKRRSFEREYAVQKEINEKIGHQNVPATKWIRFNGNRYLLKEWINGGSLYDILRDDRFDDFKASKLRKLFFDLINKLESNKYITDLHGENIFWDNNKNNWVIIDSNGIKTIDYKESIFSYYHDQKAWIDGVISNKDDPSKIVNYSKLYTVLLNPLKDEMIQNYRITEETFGHLFMNRPFYLKSNNRFLAYKTESKQFFFTENKEAALPLILKVTWDRTFLIKAYSNEISQNLNLQYDASEDNIYWTENQGSWEKFDFQFINEKQGHLKLMTENKDFINLKSLTSSSDDGTNFGFEQFN